MRTLVLACGNPLRGEDSAAHEVLQALRQAPDREVRETQQLTPERAAEIAPFHRVVFMDADAAVNCVTIEPVLTTKSRSPLTHFSSPEEIVALARALFAFKGKAFLCRIPARNFAPGTRIEEPVISQAAKELERFL